MVNQKVLRNELREATVPRESTGAIKEKNPAKGRKS